MRRYRQAWQKVSERNRHQPNHQLPVLFFLSTRMQRISDAGQRRISRTTLWKLYGRPRVTWRWLTRAW